MKFTLEIRCDNAAFTDATELEVARILRKVASEIETAQGQGICMDYNGNRVGLYSFEEE